jgi:hypothetical protein
MAVGGRLVLEPLKLLTGTCVAPRDVRHRQGNDAPDDEETPRSFLHVAEPRGIVLPLLMVKGKVLTQGFV